MNVTSRRKETTVTDPSTPDLKAVQDHSETKTATKKNPKQKKVKI